MTKHKWCQPNKDDSTASKINLLSSTTKNVRDFIGLVKKRISATFSVLRVVQMHEFIPQDRADFKQHHKMYDHTKDTRRFRDAKQVHKPS